MKLIAAVDNNWGIGYNGNLLFSIPEDLKTFSKVTKEAGVVVMGRKTFESIGRLLPGRINIILSTKGIEYQPKESEKEIEYHCFSSIESIMDFLNENNLYSKTYIIGGSQIYHLFMDYCTSAMITKVYKESIKVDSYFPNLDLMDNWRIINSSPLRIYKEYKYSFNEYINFNKKEFQFT